MPGSDGRAGPATTGSGIQKLDGAYVLSDLAKLQSSMPKTGTLDISGVTQLDTAGAWLILSTARRNGTEVTGASEAHAVLLDAVRNALPPDARPRRPPRHVEMIERVDRVGRLTATALFGFGRIIGFLGQVMARSAGSLVRPWRFR